MDGRRQQWIHPLVESFMAFVVLFSGLIGSDEQKKRSWSSTSGLYVTFVIAWWILKKVFFRCLPLNHLKPLASFFAHQCMQKIFSRSHAAPSFLRVNTCTRLEYCSTFDSVSCLCRSCRASVCPFSLSCRVASCSFISLCDTRRQQTTGLSWIT